MFFKILDMTAQIFADERAGFGPRRLHLQPVALFIDRGHDVVDLGLHGFRRDAVRRVIGFLLVAPAIGFRDRVIQRIRHFIGVEQHPPVHIPRSAADGLHQRGGGAQIAFLIGVEDRDERAFGDVEPLAQQVDANQHIKGADAQIADDFNPFQRIDVGMNVANAQTGFMHVFGQRFGHLLRQGGDEGAIARGGRRLRLGDHVVHLGFGRPDDANRVDQPGRADHLFDEHPIGPRQLPFSRRRGNEDGRGAHRLPFLKLQRTVIGAGRQPKAIFRQSGFPVPVAFEHPADLRDHHMAFIHDQKRIVGQIFKQGRRRHAGRTAGEVARVVFDPVADARRLEHLKIESRPFAQPLRFKQFALGVQLLKAKAQLFLNAL